MDYRTIRFRPSLSNGTLKLMSRPAPDAAEFQVRQKLGLVDWLQLVHGLEFEYQVIGDDDVHDQVAVERDVFIDDRQLHLLAEINTA